MQVVDGVERNASEEDTSHTQRLHSQGVLNIELRVIGCSVWMLASSKRLSIGKGNIMATNESIFRRSIFRQRCRWGTTKRQIFSTWSDGGSMKKSIVRSKEAGELRLEATEYWIGDVYCADRQARPEHWNRECNRSPSTRDGGDGQRPF